MGRAGKIRVGSLAAFAVGNSIADLVLTVAWSAGHACAPRQDTPPSGNMFTHAIHAPALAFAIIGALATFGVLVPGSYRAIRDDEVYDLTRPLLFARLTYTFLTDIPLLALQFYFISLVGLPPNFFIVKLSMTVLSLFVSGWSLLRQVLDRYGLLWGPMREHPRITVLVFWCVFGVGLPLFLALGFPTTYPAGFELAEYVLLARKYSVPACTFPNDTYANWTVYQTRTNPTYQIEHSPVFGSGAPDVQSKQASPFIYRMIFTKTDLIPASSNITFFSVQEGKLWSTRFGNQRDAGSLWGSLRIQFLQGSGNSLFLDIQTPSLYFENSFKGTKHGFTGSFYDATLCLHTTFPPVVASCSLATCDPTTPWIQFGVSASGRGLKCATGFSGDNG